MRLSDVNIMQLIPQFMREDDTIAGLVEGSNNQIHEAMVRLKLLSRWNQIDNMNDNQLDAMAWELNIPWYDSMATIEAKREIIKQSDLVHAKLGTKWAVESILSAYYGEVWVEEWWEYGAEVHHFKLLTTNPKILNDQAKFNFFLETIKRKSSWFDGVTVALTGDTPVYVAPFNVEHSLETYIML